MSTAPSSFSSDVVGLVPAAGWGRRLGTLPFSKEMYPITVAGEETAPGNVKVASHYLLENLREAGAQQTFVILRDGKWDIPSYWGDGHSLGMHLAYLMMRLPHGTPFTLDQGYPFVRNRIVAMGFPDIVLEPADTYVHLLDRLRSTGADVVLGLFPTSRPEKADMVDLDDEGRPRSIIIKPPSSSLTYTWVCAVWAPSFTEFLHDRVATAAENWDHDEREMYVGHVLQSAMEEGLSVEAVPFPDGHFADIGTPNELASTLRRRRQQMSRA